MTPEQRTDLLKACDEGIACPTLGGCIDLARALKAVLASSRAGATREEIHAALVACFDLPEMRSLKPATYKIYNLTAAVMEVLASKGAQPAPRKIGHKFSCVTINCAGCGSDFYSEDFSNV